MSHRATNDARNSTRGTKETLPVHPKTPSLLPAVEAVSSTNLIVLDSPKHAPNSAGDSPHKEPLTSQSSILSFTGFAMERFEASSEFENKCAPGNEEPASMQDTTEQSPSVLPSSVLEDQTRKAPLHASPKPSPSEFEEAKDQSSKKAPAPAPAPKPLPPVFKEAQDQKEPRPKPAPRKMKSGHSMEDLTAAVKAVDGSSEGITHDQEVVTDYPSTTFPRPTKPKPKPKMRTGPSASSTEDIVSEIAAADGGEKSSQESTPTGDGDYSSTTYPRTSKPKPKPRGAKVSESGEKVDKVHPVDDAALSQDTAKNS